VAKALKLLMKGVQATEELDEEELEEMVRLSGYLWYSLTPGNFSWSKPKNCMKRNTPNKTSKPNHRKPK
jgi:hypothetical protein